jgi:dTDP-L-rhamnose 4-epimerase
MLQPVPTREDDKAMPASIYAAGKYAQEDLVKVACKALGIDYAILRLQNVYGEGQSLKNPYTGILSIFSTRLRQGQMLPIFEDGLETRDFVHVADVAKAFQLCVESAEPVADTCNVGTGLKTTMLDIANALADAFGITPEVRVTAEYRLGDIRHNCADVVRLRARFGWVPGIEMTEGMKRFVAWVKDQPEGMDRLEVANSELRARGLMK